MRVSYFLCDYYAIFLYKRIIFKINSKINVEISGRGASCGQLHS